MIHPLPPFLAPAPLVPLVLGALALLGREEVRLADTPGPGAARALAVEVETVQHGGELEVEMDGSPVPSEYLPQLDLDLTDRRGLELVDTYADAAEGWVRAFEVLTWTNAGTMAMSGEQGDQEWPWDAAGESPLEGRAVRFADGAAVAFADGRDGDAALLAGLGADLGFGALLPDGPVELGAAWTVDGAELAGLFEPGGDLAWELPPEAAQHMLPDVRSREHAGELELVLERVEDGRAHCTVTGELVRTSVQAGDLTQVPVTEGTATDTVTATWEVAGHLVWHLAEERPVELALEGPFREATRTVRDEGQPGPTYESLFAIDGTRRLRAACEPGDDAVRAAEAGSGR
jgi:hypothetical protein